MDSSVAQPLQMIDTQPVDGGSYWINGLLTGLKRSELYLHRGGAPAVQSTTRQLLDSSTLVAETLSKLRRWGINTWADLLTPEERLTTELPHILPQDLQLPLDIMIEPPHLRQGQFWYKTTDPERSLMVIEIMNVTPVSYQYREWLPTVRGMRHAVGRMVEWEAPDIETGSEEWHTSHHYDNEQLTHRLLMGDRKGFGRHRWCRTIQGAYRSIRPVEPQLMDTIRREDAVLTQIHMLQTQLQRLGPCTMYTDGGWEYGGDGMDAPFHPYTDSPSHKGGEHSLPHDGSEANTRSPRTLIMWQSGLITER